MGKSDRGPDMQDCSTYLWEMQQAAGVDTTVLLELDGSVGGCGWRMHVLSVPKLPAAWQQTAAVATFAHWPSRECATFEGALFRALAEHDAALHKQEFIEIVTGS